MRNRFKECKTRLFKIFCQIFYFFVCLLKNRQLLREDIVNWMCELGYDDCQKECADSFHVWMNTNNPDANNKIEPSLRKRVYCEAIKKGDEKEWMFLWNR